MAASVAAETVPEYSRFVPRFAPWLMPESTRSGGFSMMARTAIFTQSAGVPETACPA